MAAESAAFVDDLIVPEETPKIFTYYSLYHGPHLIGSVGSQRLSQILRYQLSLPLIESDHLAQEYKQHPMKYMVDVFIPALQSALDQNGFTKGDGSMKQAGALLVGYNRHLYDIQADYQVCEPQYKYDAIGATTSCAVALGALRILAKLPIDPERKVRLAIEAAITHSAFSSGDIRTAVLNAE